MKPAVDIIAGHTLALNSLSPPPPPQLWLLTLIGWGMRQFSILSYYYDVIVFWSLSQSCFLLILTSSMIDDSHSLPVAANLPPGYLGLAPQSAAMADRRVSRYWLASVGTEMPFTCGKTYVGALLELNIMV